MKLWQTSRSRVIHPLPRHDTSRATHTGFFAVLGSLFPLGGEIVEALSKRHAEIFVRSAWLMESAATLAVKC